MKKLMLFVLVTVFMFSSVACSSSDVGETDVNENSVLPGNLEDMENTESV